MFGWKRWWFTACALFMLCPRRSYVAASPTHEWFNSKKLLNSNTLNVHGKPFVQRSSNIVGNDGASSRLEEVEPGFDFDEEEMKKLKIWPGGVIPYYIDNFSFDKVFRDRIRNILDMTNSMTGLNFLELHRPPGDEETRWVFFVNRQGLLKCIDHPFKNFTSNGIQKVLLGYDCLNSGRELAEVILALVGVPPQHNAPDRDLYIQIIKENIMPGKANLFEALKDKEWLFHDIDYDFSSAGHYNLHKYTVNGQATIKPTKVLKDINFGETKGFSYTDIWKIRMIYNYISKKRLRSATMPECNKLFDIGTNISHDVPDSEEDVKPRKKPNKYLGLPNESTKSPTKNETRNTVTKPNTVSENKKKSKEKSSKESNPIDEQNTRYENEKLHKWKGQLNKELSESKEESGSREENINDQVIENDDRDDVEQYDHKLKFVNPSNRHLAASSNKKNV